MIIGEFNKNDFDGYEEDSYDYLFKKKPKGTRQEKRLVRKENKQPKKGRTLKGKRKHPLLGNFGMFDKNKKKQLAGEGANPEAASPSDENLSEAHSSPTEQSSTPDPGITPPSSVAAEPPTTPINESSSVELRIPSSKINAIVPTADDPKEEQPTVAKSILPTPVEPKTLEKEKEITKGSNVKEAGFSSLLGFAFLGITIILVGFTLFKVDKKSTPQPVH